MASLNAKGENVTAKISKERLEQYSQMANRDLLDIDHQGFNPFFTRAREEGVDLISNNFSNLGMS